MDKIYTFPNTKETKDMALEVLKSFIGPDLPETQRGGEEQNENVQRFNKLMEELRNFDYDK